MRLVTPGARFRQGRHQPQRTRHHPARREMAAALTARRILAFTDSIALVVQTMRRISVSKRRNGVIPARRSPRAG